VINHHPINKQSISICLTALFLLVALLGPSTLAQGLPAVIKNSTSPAVAPPTAVPQNVMTALSNLPEADTLLYVNLHRIGTEAAPRVLPEKELAELRQNLDEMKKDIGVDPTTLDFLVLQVRFKKPDANLNFSLPEFMAVASGDFSAEGLVQKVKDAPNGKLRDERYGSKTLWLMTIDEVAKEAEKTPFLKSLSEIAIVALDGNTIAVGTPGYLKAAIDAAGGKGRISPDLLNSVMRDPEALVSVAGSPWTAFAKTFALLGTENNPRAARCDSKLGDFYAAITMDATSIKFRGAMNADNPDTAKIFKSLLSTLLQQANGLTKDKDAQAVLSSLVITPTDTEVLVQAEVSLKTIGDFIRDQGAPKKQETTETTTSPTTKHRTRRTTKRRHRTPPPPPPPAKP
jgi:hypothetical protein